MASRHPVLRNDSAYADKTMAKAAIEKLSAADLVRLTQIARARALALVDMEWRDLLYEAIVRMLAGTRRWPIDIPIVAFLAQTMRSIANEHRRHAAQRGIAVDIEEVPALSDGRPSVVRQIEARQRLRAVLDHFAQDEDIMHIISGHERGETASETIARTGLGARRFDAARKRLRRTLSRLMDEGKL